VGAGGRRVDSTLGQAGGDVQAMPFAAPRAFIAPESKNRPENTLFD
jgi:hypothetical protein